MGRGNIKRILYSKKPFNKSIFLNICFIDFIEIYYYVIITNKKKEKTKIFMLYIYIYIFDSNFRPSRFIGDYSLFCFLLEKSNEIEQFSNSLNNNFSFQRFFCFFLSMMTTMNYSSIVILISLSISLSLVLFIFCHLTFLFLFSNKTTQTFSLFLYRFFDSIRFIFCVLFFLVLIFTMTQFFFRKIN